MERTVRFRNEIKSSKLRSWWRSGFDNVNGAFPKNWQSEWFVEWDRASRMPGTFLEECMKTAEQVSLWVPLPIALFMSGGKDSEVVARCLLEIDAPFEAVIVQLGQGINDHDITYAVDFCKKNSINYSFLETDIFKFYADRKTHMKYLSYDRATSYSDWMWIADHIQDKTILCGNGMLVEFFYKAPPGLKVLPANEGGCDAEQGSYLFSKALVDQRGVSFTNHQLDPSPWYFSYSEREGDTWQNYFNFKQVPAVTKFFSHNPEIALATVTDPLVEQALNNEISGLVMTAHFKNEFFKSHFPDIAKRDKFTGYEKLKDRAEYKEYKSQNWMPGSLVKHKRWWAKDFIDSLRPEGQFN